MMVVIIMINKTFFQIRESPGFEEDDFDGVDNHDNEDNKQKT